MTQRQKVCMILGGPLALENLIMYYAFMPHIKFNGHLQLGIAAFGAAVFLFGLLKGK